jgi:uncharacterized protein
MTPLLVLFFGFKPSIAIGTDIVHGAIFKSFGAVQHRRLGHVHARLTAWMLLGSAPFSILGVALAWWLRREYGDGYEDTAKAILGVALVVCGIAFLVKAYLHSSREDKPFLLTNRDRAIAVATGVVGGFVVGLTSVGSGTLFGLVMLIAFPLTAARSSARTSSTLRSSWPSPLPDTWSRATSTSPRPAGSFSARCPAC